MCISLSLYIYRERERERYVDTHGLRPLRKPAQSSNSL